MASSSIEIVGPIERATLISTGRGIRELRRLITIHGPGRWRKLKGYARVRLPNGAVVHAEVHWYEAHGVGMKELRIKRLVDE